MDVCENIRSKTGATCIFGLYIVDFLSPSVFPYIFIVANGFDSNGDTFIVKSDVAQLSNSLFVFNL